MSYDCAPSPYVYPVNNRSMTNDWFRVSSGWQAGGSIQLSKIKINKGTREISDILAGSFFSGMSQYGMYMYAFNNRLQGGVNTPESSPPNDLP